MSICVGVAKNECLAWVGAHECQCVGRELVLMEARNMGSFPLEGELHVFASHPE